MQPHLPDVVSLVWQVSQHLPRPVAPLPNTWSCKNRKCANYGRLQHRRPKDIAKPQIIFGAHRKTSQGPAHMCHWSHQERCDHCAGCLCCICRTPVQHLWMWSETGACAQLARVRIHCVHCSCKHKPSPPTPFHDARPFWFCPAPWVPPPERRENDNRHVDRSFCDWNCHQHLEWTCCIYCRWRHSCGRGFDKKHHEHLEQKPQTKPSHHWPCPPVLRFPHLLFQNQPHNDRTPKSMAVAEHSAPPLCLRTYELYHVRHLLRYHQSFQAACILASAIDGTQ